MASHEKSFAPVSAATVESAQLATRVESMEPGPTQSANAPTSPKPEPHASASADANPSIAILGRDASITVSPPRTRAIFTLEPDASATAKVSKSRSIQYLLLKFFGAMPSSSRYLATVLRAMSTPSDERISAILESLSGARGDSPPTIARMRSFTDELATPPPEPES